MSEPIVSFDEQAIRNDLRELVRQTVEDTLNRLLEEADAAAALSAVASP